MRNRYLEGHVSVSVTTCALCMFSAIEVLCKYFTFERVPQYYPKDSNLSIPTFIYYFPEDIATK